jgi:hypothetical protein
MADLTDNGLRASIKALDEVVAPAVDAGNPLAVEQLRLVSRFLGFLRSRLQYQAERDRFELRHYLALAGALRADAAACGPSCATLIADAIDAGTTPFERGDASTHEIRSAVERLTAAVSVLVRSVADADPTLRQRVERTVVAASKSLFDVQRAWYLPIGFEPDPEQVPNIEAALSAAARQADPIK